MAFLSRNGVVELLPNEVRLSAAQSVNDHKRNSTTDDARRQLQAHVRRHAQRFHHEAPRWLQAPASDAATIPTRFTTASQTITRTESDWDKL